MFQLSAQDFQWVEKEVFLLLRRGNLPRQETDDARQEGYLALLQCAERFSNGHFYAFAKYRIRGAMIDHVRKYAT